VDSAKLDALLSQVSKMADRVDALYASRQDAEFNETDHPRAEDGKFGSGGGKQRSGAGGKGGVPTTSKLFSRRGNVAGFMKNGEEVVGSYLPKTKQWQVWTGSGGGLVNAKLKLFISPQDADAYAKTLIDKAKTKEKELAW
jgi:hypothetical protein